MNPMEALRAAAEIAGNDLVMHANDEKAVLDIAARIVRLVEQADASHGPAWLADAAAALGECAPDGTPLALTWTQVLDAIRAQGREITALMLRAESAEDAREAAASRLGAIAGIAGNDLMSHADAPERVMEIARRIVEIAEGGEPKGRNE